MSNKFEKVTLDRVESCRRMFDGERLYLDNEGISYAAFHPDYGFKIKSHDSDDFGDIVGLFHDQERDWYIKNPWYSSIPPHGVLCNVRYPQEVHKMIRLVVNCIYKDGVRKAFILDDAGVVDYAEPLTDKEIKQFLRGEL